MTRVQISATALFKSNEILKKFKYNYLLPNNYEKKALHINRAYFFYNIY